MADSVADVDDLAVPHDPIDRTNVEYHPVDPRPPAPSKAEPVLTDERLAEIAAAHPLLGDEVGQMADELLRRRRYARKDSRKAEQLRRCRWTMENVLVKLEALAIKESDRDDI